MSVLKHLRSSTADKRPVASGIADGQLAINTASGTPALFFRDSASGVVKVGPAHVGPTAPNAVPAGSAGNSRGELWIDNSTTINGLNYYNGSSFINLTPSGTTSVAGLVELATGAETQAGTDGIRAVTPSGLQSKVSDSISTTSSTTIASATAVKTAYDLANAALARTGGTVTGEIVISPSGSISFEGSTDDGFETTLAVVNPTADRTITFPNITGTLITNADTGTVTSAMIADGAIVDADINASASIALSKLATGALPSGITIASSNIVDGTIINDDISISAAIADTKLATISSADKVSLSALNIDGGSDIGADLADADLIIIDDGGGGTNRKSNVSRIPPYVFSKVSGDIAIASNGTASISNGVIVDADVNASAAIAGTKISPNFGSQAVTTTGTSTAASFIPTSATVPTNGIYLPAANSVGISTNGSGRLFVDSSGRILAGVSSTSATATAVLQGNSFSSTAASVLFMSRGGLPSVAGDGLGLIRFGDNSQNYGAQIQTIAEAAWTAGASYPSALLFWTTASGTTGATERLRITSDGKVGIGTSSPLASLHVAGNSLATTYFWNRIGSGEATATRGLLFTIDGTDYGRVYSPNGKSVAIQAGSGTLTDALTVDQAGRVGVGTTTVQAKLHVREGTDKNIYIGTGSGTGARIAAANDANNALVLLDLQGSELSFTINASESARLDSSGRLLVGTSTARTNFYNGTDTGIFQVEGANDITKRFSSFVYGRDNSDGPLLLLGKHRGTSVGGTTVVASGDEIGRITFQGSDGTQFVAGAEIYSYVDGTPGADDMPGRLVFATTADGASSPTERARITSGGYFKASNSGVYTNAAAAWHELYQNASSQNLIAYCSNASYAAAALEIAIARAANTAYSFLQCYSSAYSASDLEIHLRGDGNAFADGTWTGGGADYAEYFEWSDGNPDADDRRGISVVLDGDKIREAVAGEDPIGVISGNPSIVGDAAWNKWSGKYLRDEFGTYILEDYEVTDEEGNTVTQQRRKLNPAYDPNVEYIPREQRSEWDCVGLMGKLRIRKGQVTGSRWIKMRDINDSVEEWLVR